MRTDAILPVKGFSQAKQRLRSGLSPELREALVEAMLADVLSALERCESIDRIVVVSAGSRAQELAREHGADVLQDSERGHNPAVALGIEAALKDRVDRVLLVPGDCPALDPGEVDELLGRPAQVPSVVIVPDRHGTGTNALLITPPDALEPSFGPESCERHAAHARAAGVHAEVVAVPSLAMDVDTPDDLEALDVALGSASRAAPRTRALITQLISTRC
jgi:2-phospho-L-lactate guanylyltransferase